MREIKFRAWDGHNMWYEGGNGDYFLTKADFFNRPDVEIMQFTGLTDKRGNEIYEGDILATRYNHVVRLAVHNFQMSAVAVDADLRSRCHHIPLIDLLSETDERGEWSGKADGEIIGNIYANPELAAASADGVDAD